MKKFKRKIPKKKWRKKLRGYNDAKTMRKCSKIKRKISNMSRKYPHYPSLNPPLPTTYHLIFQVTLSLSGDAPLVVEYAFGDLGQIRYYLAPKIEEDDNNWFSRQVFFFFTLTTQYINGSVSAEKLKILKCKPIQQFKIIFNNKKKLK